jgi:16S rRNA A1518/A1519 N6-dimethyltransferase RsmA/KsgA/DIM1 with predicted DNA glycosylase/AP lyase activity
MLIRGACFYPRPKVDSRGLVLDLRAGVDANTYPSCFYPLVRQLFSSRRKMIKNNLRGFIRAKALNPECITPGEQPALPSGAGLLIAGRDRDTGGDCEELLRASGLKGDERAENLGIDDFLALAKNLENMRALGLFRNSPGLGTSPRENRF